MKKYYNIVLFAIFALIITGCSCSVKFGNIDDDDNNETEVVNKKEEKKEENKSNCPKAVGVGTYIINYESNGGEKIEKQTVCKTCADAKNEFQLPTPKKDGYTFDGWYADEALTKKVSNGTGQPEGANWKDSPLSPYEN